MSLKYLSRIPEGAEDGTPVVLLLHGRGSHEGDLINLSQAFAQSAVLAPRGPHPGAPWGYGPGFAWYRYVREDRVISQTLHDSLAALDSFLDNLPEILSFAPGPILMGGFSQGGTTSLAYALSRLGRLAGVLNFSGYLVNEETLEPREDVLSPLHLFWGHGTEDPQIPFSLALKGRKRLKVETPSLVTEARDYPIGHGIDPVELQDASAWWEGLLQQRV